MHRRVTNRRTVEESEEKPSTSSALKGKLVPSYTYSSWKKLRDVCRALQETQERVAVQRKEVETILEEEKEFRELAEQVQCAGVQLKALRDDIEKIKCRIMTCRMKLIHLNDEKFKKDLETNQRYEEVMKIEAELPKRKAAFSLAKDNVSVIASHVAWRRRKMVKDLMLIYVINLNTSPEERLIPSPCTCRSVACIAGLHLPDEAYIPGHSDVEVSAATGYVIQVLSLLSRIYDFPYQYRMLFWGSKSTIKNPVNEEIHHLYGLTRKRENQEGIFLLNKNLAQLRWSFGLTTKKFGKTLFNLQDLLLHIVNERKSPESNVNKPNNSTDTLKIINHGYRSMDGDHSNFSRQRSIGSNRTLLYDSTAVDAVSLAFPPNNAEDQMKAIPVSKLSTNDIISS